MNAPELVDLAQRRILRDIEHTRAAMLDHWRDHRPAPLIVSPAAAPAVRAYLTGRPQSVPDQP